MKTYQPILLAAAIAGVVSCGGSDSTHAQIVPSRVIFSSVPLPDNVKKDYAQLYSMALDGSDVRQLTNVTFDASEPVACDDGSKILFTGQSWLSTNLYVMNRDGSNMVNLTKDLFGHNYAPCYCGDGAEIVFESNKSGSHQVWKMDADGSNPTRLTGPGREDSGAISSPDTEQSYSPDFSHDNKKIVYVRGADSQIWMMDGNGSNKVDLKQVGTTPRFNEVGSLIVFARDGDIYTMHTNGTVVKKLTADRGEIVFEDPAISPDGRKIVFTGRNTACEVYVMNVDGSGLARLTYEGREYMHPNFICDRE